MKKNIIVSIAMVLLMSCIGQRVKDKKYLSYIDSLKSNGFEIINTVSGRFVFYGKLDTINFKKNDSIFCQFNILDTNPEKMKDSFWFSRELFCDSSGSFCMFNHIKIEIDTNVVSFINLIKIPINKGEESITCKLLKTTIIFKNKSILSYNTKFILDSIPEYENDDIVNEYYALKKKGVDNYLTNEDGLDYLTNFITKLYISSFFNDKSRNILVNIKKDLPVLTDSILGEMYYSWAIIYNIYAKSNHKVQIEID